MTEPTVRAFGLQNYHTAVERMREFTDTRTAQTPDELWVLQHASVYTLGQAGDEAHILNADGIEVVKTDRGGQVTYHGPGQLIVYVLVDLKRGSLGVRTLVQTMENAVIELLARHGVESNSRRDAPGVYVNDKKISALGLRVRRGCTFHGLSLNVDMDLTPFTGINPCGYAGLSVTQLKNEGVDLTVEQAGEALVSILIDALQIGNKAG